MAVPSSLFSNQIVYYPRLLYYAEASDKFAEPSLRHCASKQQSSFWRNIAGVASRRQLLCLIWPVGDLNFRPPETNAFVTTRPISLFLFGKKTKIPHIFRGIFTHRNYNQLLIDLTTKTFQALCFKDSFFKTEQHKKFYTFNVISSKWLCL